MLIQFLNRIYPKEKHLLKGNHDGCLFALGAVMDKTKDLLYQAVKFYDDNLAGKRFEIVAGKNNAQNTQIISFEIERFYHLLGLQKLKDVPLLKRSARKVYYEILQGKITYNDISYSEYLVEMEDRLIYHRELLNILDIKSIYYKSLHGEFKTIEADYFLCNEIIPKSLYGFLFSKSNSVPVTFFTRYERDSYIRNSIKWTVLSIREVEKNTNPNKATVLV